MNETLKRALSGAIYLILLIASIKFSVESYFVLFGVFLLITVSEFCSLVKLPKLNSLIIAGGIYLLFYTLRFEKIFDLPILIITLLVSIKSVIFLFDDKQTKLKTLSKYVYLFGYIIFPFVIIAKIPFGINGFNPKIIISIFILIWTNDTFAYLVGKSIGKNKLLEKVSPKKTIEGFFGGVIFAIIASYIISKYYIEIKESNIYIWIITAFIISIFGTIGDLIESKFKRIAGVKDSGIIMPGHGGILDRLDSVIFVAPIIFLFYQILNYVS